LENFIGKFHENIGFGRRLRKYFIFVHFGNGYCNFRANFRNGKTISTSIKAPQKGLTKGKSDLSLINPNKGFTKQQEKMK
jgi:hypothetical protein